MSFTLLKNTFTDLVDKVPASWLNTAATYLSRALDAANGGAYTPASKIQVAGAGLELNGNDATAAGWLQLGSRTVTRVQPLTLAMVVQNVGPGSNVDSLTIGEGDAVTSLALHAGSKNIASGCILTTLGAQNSTNAKWGIVGLPRLPDKATITSVAFATKGINTASPSTVTLPYYRLVKIAPGGTITPIDAALQVDDHTVGGGQNWATKRTQTLTPSGGSNAVVDLANFDYGILVECPFEAAGAQVQIYQPTVTLTVTQMRV